MQPDPAADLERYVGYLEEVWRAAFKLADSVTSYHQAGYGDPRSEQDLDVLNELLSSKISVQNDTGQRSPNPLSLYFVSLPTGGYVHFRSQGEQDRYVAYCRYKGEHIDGSIAAGASALGPGSGAAVNVDTSTSGDAGSRQPAALDDDGVI